MQNLPRVLPGGGEYKYMSTNSAWDANLAEEVTYLCDIDQGSDVVNRIGRRILLTGFEGRLQVRPNPNAAETLTTIYGRLLLVYDKRSNGAACSSTQILSHDGVATWDGVALYNYSFFERFIILTDDTFSLGPRTDGAGPVLQPGVALPGQSYVWSKSFRLPKLPVVYTATTGEIANCSAGSLHLFMLVSSASVLMSTSHLRVQFMDD